ncbi:Tol-Pal system protein TolR [subsurface metagenome]
MRDDRIFSPFLLSSRSSDRSNTLGQFLNLTPLADIIFTLIIFFMLTSPFITQWGIKVNLPSVKNVTNIRLFEAEVRITADDRIFLKGKEVSLVLLRDELKVLAGKGVPVLITGDKDASLGRTLEVWDAAKEMGIKELNVRTLIKKSK